MTSTRFGTEHGSYSLTTLPGCPQVCVSHSAFIKTQSRGQGHGQKDHKQRLRKVQELGYDYVLCTVVSSNSAQKHILSKHGWEYLSLFFSSSTRNCIELWGKRVY